MGPAFSCPASPQPRSQNKQASTMNFTKLATAAAVALTITTAQAGLFDPDGGGPAPAINLGPLDWGPANFLALGGQAAVTSFVGSGGACPAGSCTFSVLTQATLIGTLSP